MADAAVDRTRRIRSWAFSEANPGRWHVVRAVWGKSFVFRGMAYVDSFPSHAEAIAYADRRAREEARATVQAEALRDAADAMDADVEVRDPLRLRADWLRARADRLDPKEK